MYKYSLVTTLLAFGTSISSTKTQRHYESLLVQSESPPFEFMQKSCCDHIGGQMMAGSMQVIETFLKHACTWTKLAMLMCCLTWHPATCYFTRHWTASQRYVPHFFMLVARFIASCL